MFENGEYRNVSKCVISIKWIPCPWPTNFPAFPPSPPIFFPPQSRTQLFCRQGPKVLLSQPDNLLRQFSSSISPVPSANAIPSAGKQVLFCIKGAPATQFLLWFSSVPPFSGKDRSVLVTSSVFFKPPSSLLLPRTLAGLIKGPTTKSEPALLSLPPGSPSYFLSEALSSFGLQDIVVVLGWLPPGSHTVPSPLNLRVHQRSGFELEALLWRSSM